MAVHVVGNVALDTTFRLARFPEPGETVNATGASVALGGKGANQALAALRGGAETWLWAALGQDSEAEAIRRGLAREGLGDRFLTALPLPSDRSTILIDASGENQIVSAVACARAYDPLGAGWAGVARAGDMLVLQGNLGLDVTRAMLDAARAASCRTLLNASPLEDGASMPLGADVVIVNRGEAVMLTGERDPAEAARALIARGAGSVVVTLGGEGALVLSGGDPMPMRIPARSVRALYTSGAGDVFCGTLAARLSLGDGLGRAAQFAGAAAALAVTRAGTFGCGPSAAEFQTLLESESL